MNKKVHKIWEQLFEAYLSDSETMPESWYNSIQQLLVDGTFEEEKTAALETQFLKTVRYNPNPESHVFASLEEIYKKIK